MTDPLAGWAGGQRALVCDVVPFPPENHGTRRVLLALSLSAFVLMIGGGGHTQTATTADCSDNPGSNERVECSELSTSTADVLLDLSNVNIDTTVASEHGVLVNNQGTGDIVIEVSDSTITTAGSSSRGINLIGQDDIVLKISGSTITTAGSSSRGIGVNGKGDITVEIIDTEINVDGASGYTGAGIYNSERNGNVVYVLKDVTVTTKGDSTRGVNVFTTDAIRGTVEVDLSDVMITTEGSTSPVIHLVSRDSYVEPDSNGDTVVVVQNSHIVSKGVSSPGILADRQASVGDITINVRDSVIDTQSVGIQPQSHGISVVANNSTRRGPDAVKQEGDITIDLENVKIMTKGELSHGVNVVSEYAKAGDIIIVFRGGTLELAGDNASGVHVLSGPSDSGVDRPPGDIRIVTDSGNSIKTTGEKGHGIVAYHDTDGGDNLPTGGSRVVDIIVGGSIEVTGMDAQGVRVGAPSDAKPTSLKSYASLDEYGFRRQTVTVNGSINSTAEGVFLTNGGRVVIGPWGTIHSGSGIAILATGTVPGDSTTTPPVPAITPRLSVDFNLDGRRVAAIRDMIGDGWIINDGGRTAIAVNGHVLHDADDGPTELVVPNGAWDVMWDTENVPFGERVTDRTDPVPAMWTIEEDYEDLKDRDFSADFLIGALVETHAPRAAVYEVLPGFLHSLDASGIPWRMESERPPVWLRFSGGEGTYRPKNASVGARYDSEHQSVEAGMDFPLGDSMLSGTVSVRSLRGEARVAALTGGGGIRASGVGMGLGLHHEGTDGFYASGGYSYTDYSLDMSSNARGALVTNAGATGHTFHVETGKRLDLGKGAIVTPRAMATSRRIDIDGFTDSLGSRVSYDASRSTVAVGLLAETRGGVMTGAALACGALSISSVPSVQPAVS